MAHSIYECEGAKTCAIELRSFSKNAGFTGVRLGFTVVPKELKCGDVSLNAMWARRHGTKFNGAPYIVQRAGEAVYSDAGKAQLKEQVGYYMKNAKAIKEGLTKAGYTVFGGVNAPYIWLKTPDQMSSWDFFDYLLENANVVGTPGSGFGPSGEGYFRLTAFGSYENTLAALERIKKLQIHKSILLVYIKQNRTDKIGCSCSHGSQRKSYLFVRFCFFSTMIDLCIFF